MIFQEGIKHSERVGDIRVTTRTNLGGDWLLCNGANVDGETYPEFADKASWSSWSNKGGSIYCSNPRVFVYGEKILYAMRNASSGTSSYYSFRYSADGGESFSNYTYSNTDLNIWAVNVGGIYCYNGLWYVSSTYHSTGAILYTTDPSAKANWSVYSLGTVGSVNGIHCHEGTWVVCGSDSNGVGCVWVLGDVVNGADTFTQYTLGGEECVKAFYHNGIWGVVAVNGTTGVISLYTTNDITSGNWTETTAYSGDGDSVDVFGLYAYNGVWAISCTNEVAYARVLYSDNPTGTWRESSLGTAYWPSSICCHNGTWYVVVVSSTSSAYPILESTNDLFSGTWNSEEIVSSYVHPCEIVVNGNGIFTTGQGASSSYYLRAYKKSKVVPTISIDGAYAYIKARE